MILEPINYDAGCVVPDPGYLELVRRETEKRGIVLIFDEILSGFRTGVSGAQGYFGVTPDLSTVGKALGGGVRSRPLEVVRTSCQCCRQLDPRSIPGRTTHT